MSQPSQAQLLRRAALALVRAFRGENLRLRAMALTYISLFALIPALVVAFTVLQAFAGMEKVTQAVHEFLFDNLAVGARESVEPYLDKFVRNAHTAYAGLVGGVVLVYSAVALFGHVERAINDLWGTRRRRPLPQQLLVYWAALSLGPLALAGSLSLGLLARSWLAHAPGSAYAIRLLAVAVTCCCFAIVYLVTPTTKVRFRAALAGGALAGVTWELAKSGYALVVTRFFHYHAVYGSVAAVPIFLIWLFLSWTLFLSGARIVFVIQNARSLLAEEAPPETPMDLEISVGRTMLAIARAYERGAGAPDLASLTEALAAPADRVQRSIDLLVRGGLVTVVSNQGLVPSRPLDLITLAHVRAIVRGNPDDTEAADGALIRSLVEAEKAAHHTLDRTTLQALSREGEGGAGERAPLPAEADWGG